ncbi:MAG: tetratricopeptide repeat protein [Verrucomicrobiota bacterium]
MKLEMSPPNPASPNPAEADGGSIFGKDISVAGFHRALVLLSLLALIVRIGFYVEHANSPSFGVPTLDQKYYDTVAKMLLAGEDLHELHAFRPLLYPMFLAFFYKLGGNWGVELALLAQHLLGIATGLLVALLGARLFHHRLAGIVGGALFLLAPLPLCFEGELLIEPSYTFLICLGLLLHLHTATIRGWRGALLWLLCGGMIALASQARANILVFLAVYPLFAAWRWWHTRERAALLPLLGLAGALAMMIPWGIINLRQADRFHLVSNAGGVNFYLGNRRGADGMFGCDVVTALSELSRSNKTAATITANERYEDLVEVWAREEYSAAMRGQNRPAESDPKAISRYWTQRAVDEIKADPAAWLKLTAKKCWLTLWNKEVPNNKDFAFLQQEYFWLRVLPVRWVVLLMLAPAGLWAAARFRNRDNLFILLVYAAIYSAGNVAFFICDRYRYPVWPALAVLAGGGLLAGLEMIRQRRWRGLLSALACAGLMAAISLPNWFGAKLPNFAQDYYFRSSAWYEKRGFAEALEDINRSVELDSLNAGAQQHRGNVLFALNRMEEACRAYEQALKLIPGNSGVWNNLGATLEALGNTDAALAAYRRATECQPPSPLAFLGIAFIQIRAGQLADATATLEQLEKRQRTPRAATLATRSAIERRRGDARRADALEQQAHQLDPAAADWAIERAAKSPADNPAQKRD